MRVGFTSALLFLLVTAEAGAQTTQLLLDGSLPHGRTDDITALQSGPDYEISEDFGWRSGTNLFHSFELFDIGPADSATFTSNPALPDLSHVIARVTGGEPSDIDGRFASAIPTADVFLLNRAGILFGGASEIDVPRSLYVSTAHRLDFENTNLSLDLLNPASPHLSVEAPAAFGFYAGGPRAEVTFFNPGGEAVGKTFRVPDGETLSAVGGDVNVQNRMLLQAFGGRVQLVAAGDAEATVPVDAAQFAARDDADLGQVLVETRSSLDTLPFDTNVDQGTVVIRGGRLVLRDRSLVQAGDRIGGSGPAVDIETSVSVDIDDRSEARSVSQGPRPSGGVRISTGELSLTQSSQIRTRLLSFAPAGASAGDIIVGVDTLRLESRASLNSLNQGPGIGGDIEVTADGIELTDAEIATSTLGAGSGGGVSLTATRISAVDGVIAADGSSLADAGAVTLTGNEIELSGGKTQVRTTRPLSAPPDDPPSPGSPVAIAAEGGSVRVLDGAGVLTQTSGANLGGDIAITAATLEILDGGVNGIGEPQSSAVEVAALAAGGGGLVTIEVDTLRVGRSQGSELAGRLATVVAPEATGPGGAIVIDAASVALDGGGQISTTTLGFGAAGAVDLTAAGDVAIQGDNVVEGLAQPSGVFSRSETNADGNDVTIIARSIEVTGGGEISTRALGTGRSGSVTLMADDVVRIAGAGEQGSVVTARGTDGRGGNVEVVADRLEVLDGASIDVSTSGSGPGGLLIATVGDVWVEGEGPVPKGGGDPLRASLAAQADGTGDASGIEIDASRTVRVGPGGQITALSRGLGGSPGDIQVDSTQIDVEGGLITAESGAGGGGNIELVASRGIGLRAGAEVSVRSVAGGDAGTVQIDTPRLELKDSAIIADADAFGGNVEITGDALVHLLDSQIVAVSRGSGGGPGLAGGNVSIEAGDVVLNRSLVLADGFENANGGNIAITADAFLMSTDSLLSASSELGVEGEIVVEAPVEEVVGELSQLSTEFLDASAELEEACLARDAPAGTFAVQRTRALPPPDALFVPADAAVRGNGTESDARICEEP